MCDMLGGGWGRPGGWGGGSCLSQTEFISCSAGEWSLRPVLPLLSPPLAGTSVLIGSPFLHTKGF